MAQLYSDFASIVTETIYIEIEAGKNYAWTAESYITPANYPISDPANVFLQASLQNIGISKYANNFQLTRAYFSKYGSIGFEFNKAVDEKLSVVIGVAFIRK